MQESDKQDKIRILVRKIRNDSNTMFQNCIYRLNKDAIRIKLKEVEKTAKELKELLGDK